MATFTWLPTDAQLNKQPRVLTAGFGDGYAQDAQDGLNANPQTWEVTFEDVIATDAKAIDDFLSEQGGAIAFDFVTPFGDTLQFKCKRWSIKPSRLKFLTVTATFEQSF
jgi:phage-related protein